MARKRNAKSEEQEEFDVDEPSEVDEGANDSSSQNENAGAKSGGRRTSSRARTVKKPYRGESSAEDEEDEEEDAESEEEKPKKKGRGVGGGGGRGRGRAPTKGKPPAKKIKKEEEEENDSEENEDSEEDEEGDGEESEGDAADTPVEFRSGCFVVLKSDVDNNEEDYPVWKIDGKSLLQKFDRFKHQEEILFKGTTIYAGWSKTVINTYYPIKVDYTRIEGVDSAVKFDPSQIKKKDATSADNGAENDVETIDDAVKQEEVAAEE